MPSSSCPRCESAIQPGQKFCPECGLALAAVCPNCATPYEGSPRFCAECGTQLSAGGAAAPAQATHPSAEPERAAQHAERRHVSVLFADLVGFTTMSEEQDPEEVRELLSSYFDSAREVIERYGGSVEKFIGDAVMAVWGAPVAQEDDAERAVRAALDLVDAARKLSHATQPIELRAAVLTGEAAVTLGRTGQGMVAGDLVNTASRLQSVAPPGSVLVGETTQQATSAAIAYEPAGEQLLKGKQAPIAAWRALRVVAQRGGVGRGEGLEPPFVGRDEELRLLKDQLHATARERKLRLVSIIGQAGMGKSRLAWELLKYVDGLSEDVYWHEGRSPSYGEGVTYWALGEMVRRRCKIAEGDDELTTRASLRTTLAEFVPDEAERRWLEPALAALLGVGEADWDAREQLFAAWRTFFERVADRGMTVLVFEDLQWADSGLLDFIEHLLEWTRDRPILVVTLARPEIVDRRPSWGAGQRAFVALHLEPLSSAAMSELLGGLVPGLPAQDSQRIVERAEGVPLYAVETVRSLVDGGYLVRQGDTYQPAGELTTLEVPATLRALIASRLDALEPADRALLQDASVLGLVFATPALAALTGRPADELEQRLRVLAQRELVALQTDPRSPERGQFRFVQGLIREVAYGTLSRRDRRARHLAAAQYFETLGDDELAGVLASHYVEAYRAAPEGDEGAAVAAQARVALRAAAERAARLHSHEQALAYTAQALAVTFDEAEQNSLRLAAAQSAIRAGVSDRAEEYLRAAIAWFAGRADAAGAGATKAELGSLLLNTSRIDEGMELLQSALSELPDGADDISVRLNGEVARGHLFRGEAQAALEAVSKALEMAERQRETAATLQLLITRSWALKLLGRNMEANALLWGAMQLADAQDDLGPRLRARMNLSAYLATDDPHSGRRIAEEGAALARQFGIAAWAAPLAGNAASACLMIGDLRRIFELFDEFDAG
ncbi:MAG TPA: adenylate/guanylate cyclase domain-containing protein, partial [Candidatus Limnocylindria bacterium]|nr:adenylate/guanylate cyclase domain-containing protein [Candidatus Limnocylindria bacterium]